MTYRDDLDAAHTRSEALARQVDALARENRDLARGAPRGVNWRDVVPFALGLVATGAFTAIGLAIGFGLGWVIGGFLLFVLFLFGLIGSVGPPLPVGAVPVRLDLDLPCGDGEVAARVLVVAHVAEQGPTAEAARRGFAGRTVGEVADVAAALLEGLLRDRFAALSVDEARRTCFGAALEPAIREHLAAHGLALDHVWIGARAGRLLEGGA